MIFIWIKLPDSPGALDAIGNTLSPMDSFVAYSKGWVSVEHSHLYACPSSNEPGRGRFKVFAPVFFRVKDCAIVEIEIIVKEHHPGINY
jgi:hypothetical protein